MPTQSTLAPVMIAKSNGLVWNARSCCLKHLSRPANGIMPKATLVSIAVASAGSVRSEMLRQSNALLATFRKKRQEYSSNKAWMLGPSDRKCAFCVGKRAGQWTCPGCNHQLPKSECSEWFATHHVEHKTIRTRCNTCVESRRADTRAMIAESCKVLQQSYTR